MDFIPDKNEEYNEIEYWNTRYSNENSKDWLGKYSAFSHLINKHVKTSDKILMLGCGNSTLAEDMYKDGYHHITNIDYSPVVIDKMADHCESCRQLRWITMDMTDLQFPDGEFDVVIEKATIDALLVGETDPWKVSEVSQELMTTVLSQVSRVLKPNGGKFISITFAQPHFRLPLYTDSEYGWSAMKEEFGDSWSYFFFVMTRTDNPDLHTRWQLPPVPSSVGTSVESVVSADDFLSSIQI
ncbi:ECE2 [Cordylochernes scorpioides]|uniref:ECE2 n=1 Tax=Cordylochernes scorpioides TaxID=51811 RepID=A0ABY6LLD9_9ARAC|nr:ECE2 [Cordylochernes scorpioides]